VSQPTLLYIADDGDRLATVARDVQVELPSLAVRVTPELSPGEVDTDVACVVYDAEAAAGDTLDRFAEVREEWPALPFVVVCSPGDPLVGAVLDADRTTVVRWRGEPADAAILANRIERLVGGYRRDRRLEHEQARFETLFEVLTQATVEVAFEGETPIIRRANRAFEETFGYDEAELVGESLDDVVVPPGKEAEARRINRRVLSGEVFSVEVTRQTADGEREFLLRNAVYPDSSKEFAMYTDITDRKERERQLRETTEKLEESNRKLRRQNERLDQFASVVSHDLRNPLTIAQLQAEFAAETGDDEHFGTLQEALGRMEGMIDDLMALARTEATLEETESLSLAVRARSAWRTTETGSAELTVAVPHQFELDADPDLLRHVFENLYRNAVDHNEQPPGVTVGLLDGDDPAGFYVEDDGRGIPPGEREDVFDYGYTTDERGTGLGLSIVADLVDIHGWEIAITDGSGGGARFEIRW